MKSAIDAIKKRVSIRTYSDKPIEPAKLERIATLLQTHTQGPFGNQMRFELIDFSAIDKNEIKNLGTYGIISGAPYYIVNAIKESERAMEDVGYCFERIILEITDMELGTCWMGGTFKRAGFARQINVTKDEIVPAISPVGYPHSKRSIKDRAIRRLAKSDQRKPWDEIFFEYPTLTPLSQENAHQFTQALECVRLAPSATNLQPWRIIKEKGTDVLHFYLKRTSGYDKVLKAVDLQRIDMGIAMCHFDLAAREAGLEGKWVQQNPEAEIPHSEYVVSWVRKNS